MKDKVVVLGSFIIAILILVLIKSNEYFTVSTPISIVNIGYSLEDAVGIALDNNNNIFVLSTNENGILYKITPTYTISTVLSTNLSLPQKVALDTSGNIYIADSRYDLIYKFDNNTYPHVQSYTGFTSPQGVAIDSARNIYVGDAGANKLYYIPSGTTTTKIISYTNNGLTDNTFKNIRKVVVSSTDDIYVLCDGLTSSTSYMVIKVGNMTNLGKSFSYSVVAILTTKPNSFTVDSSGNVYVVTNSSSISLYVPNQSLWILTNIPLSDVSVQTIPDRSDVSNILTPLITSGVCIFTDIVVDSLRISYITDPLYGVWKIDLKTIVEAAVLAAPGLASSQIAAANAAAEAERNRLAAAAAEAIRIAATPPVQGQFDGSGHYLDASGHSIPFQFDTEIMSKTYPIPSDYFKSVIKHYSQNPIFGSWSRY